MICKDISGSVQKKWNKTKFRVVPKVVMIYNGNHSCLSHLKRRDMIWFAKLCFPKQWNVKQEFDHNSVECDR